MKPKPITVEEKEAILEARKEPLLTDALVTERITVKENIFIHQHSPK